MKEYMFSLIGASLIAGIVSLFLPEGSANSRVVKMLAALCVISALAVPLSGASCDGNVSGIFDSILESTSDLGAEDKYYGILTELGRDELEKKLTELICEKFSVDENNISVSVEALADGGEFSVRRVAIGLRGVAVFCDPYDIEEFVTSLVGVDCDTYY